ncbi:MAG TPA: universal stress protein [Candidatus Bathyarchaeia archaeon]
MGERKPEQNSKEKPGPEFKRILVAVDGSENSERAARVAVDLAERWGSELTVFHVVPRVSHAFVPVRSTLLFRAYYSDQEKAALKWIDKVMSLAKSRGVEAKPDVRVAAPSVAEEIVRYAGKKNVDLIVVGTRGLGSFRKLLVGSVSSGVVAHAHCPVLVVR